MERVNFSEDNPKSHSGLFWSQQVSPGPGPITWTNHSIFLNLFASSLKWDLETEPSHRTVVKTIEGSM